MTAQLAAYGRLGADPVERTAQSGKAWATATIAVDAASGDEDAKPLWLGVIAFGRAAETLCRHAKGDLISVAGRLQLRRYDDREGHQRETLQVVADSIISAKTVRPGGRRRDNNGGGE